MRLLNRQAIALDKTGYFFADAQHNISISYFREKKYKKALEGYRKALKLLPPKAFVQKSVNLEFTAIAYLRLKEYKKGLAAIDSAIAYEKKVLDIPLPSRMVILTLWKKKLLYEDKQYKKAYDNYVLFQKYRDTVVDVKREKRLTEMEVSYQFEKEKEIAAIQLDNANTKKKLYIILLIIVLTLGFVVIYFILKSKKQKMELAKSQIAEEQMEKMKAKLALANRESELKKILIESSITEEALNKTLDDIKEIITNQDQSQRNKSLRSLSTSLLIEKSSQTALVSLQEHVDKVAIDFKVYLDANYTILGSKDKELLYLMKAGLNTTEISKLLKTTVASVKSKRYRIRKKLNLGSDVDIVAYLEKEMINP